MDLEMTGLDPDTCAIVQMAIILTDSELNELDDPLDITIWQPNSVLETMAPYVRSMHEKSGLLEQIRRSSVSLEVAEHRAMELVSHHCSYRTARLAGNSIQQDRRFLYKYMPCFEGYLHYRQVDVSTVKELAGYWYGGLRYEKADDETAKHTAMYDIRQSINELKFFRERVFKDPRA
ncbi:MAG: oligoribonuclease [Clostridia bacterium]|nr:oligoribonuclease [Deltaproteobacteria bacterium]